jgi:hypothetical protein
MFKILQQFSEKILKFVMQIFGFLKVIGHNETQIFVN